MYNLRRYIDFDDVTERIAIELPQYNKTEIFNGFRRFFYETQDSEYQFYSKAQCEEAIETLIIEFIKETKTPYSTLRTHYWM